MGQVTQVKYIGLIQYVSGLFFMQIGRYSLYAVSVYSKMISAVVFVQDIFEQTHQNETTI
jgi:hypothetical protein